MGKWFAVPLRQSEYETFAARVLHYTLLLLICIALLFVFFISSPQQLIFIPVLIGVLGGCYYLLHIGRFYAASLIFLIGFWLIITVASFSINGIRNASLSSYAIIIIFSAILLNNRAVMVFTGISIVSSAVLAIGETQGILPLQTTPLYLADRFFQQVSLFGAAGILLYAASRVIRASFQQIQESQQMLLERNHELEAQIMQRQRIEASLRVSDEKYRLLFENIPVMAAIYALDGEIILINYAAAQMLGGNPETLQGRNIRDVLDVEDAEQAIRDQAQVIAEGRAMLNESSAMLPTGREIYFLRHIMPLPDAAQVLVLTTDMTEKHLAEQRERELTAARERNEFLTEFFSTLSHDLKTPLTIMTTSLYLLDHAQTEQERMERLQSISQQIVLMDKFIQDMLVISRLEHLPTVTFSILELNTLIEEVIALLRPSIESKQLVCQFSKQPGLPPIQGDQEQLRRMLTNLIENAVNYTPVAGQVMVRAYTIDGQVAVEVTDSGIGIQPDAMPHIFERFFRAQNARESEIRGTGLGLAIVKKIVEAHTATIEVHSQPGEGTTFCVQFPGEVVIVVH